MLPLHHPEPENAPGGYVHLLRPCTPLAIFDQFQTGVNSLKFLLFQAYAIVPLEQYEFAAGSGSKLDSTATMVWRLRKTFLISEPGMRRCRSACGAAPLGRTAQLAEPAQGLAIRLFSQQADVQPLLAVGHRR